MYQPNNYYIYYNIQTNCIYTCRFIITLVETAVKLIGLQNENAKYKIVLCTYGLLCLQYVIDDMHLLRVLPSK